MNRSYLAVLALAVACANPYGASYAGQGTGRVTLLGASHDTNVPWVILDIENYSNHPCATPNVHLGKLVFTADSTRGREMLSILLSAEARGAVVTVVGSGACVEQSRESVNYLYLGGAS